VVVTAAACANKVKQDKATGPDGVAKGARPLELEEQERADPKAAPTFKGESRGIVTYPGGDRVDWKVIQLPEQKRGTLDLKMTWTPPRPGLRLGFDMFDGKGKPVEMKLAKMKRAREASIPAAGGTYFVRVYAENRGDAGAYKLVAAFTPEEAKPPYDPTKEAVPPPPPLPAIVIATCKRYDANDPECAKTCHKDAPSGAKGCPPCHRFARDNADCADICAPGAPASWPACVALRPPCEKFDRTDAKCADLCPKDAPADWPACKKFRALEADVKGNNIVGDEVEVLLKLGTDHGVTSAWRAVLLDGTKGTPLPGAVGRVVQWSGPSVKVRFKVTLTTIQANPRVRLSPPAAQ
jgi:hypothetical protein